MPLLPVWDFVEGYRVNCNLLVEGHQGPLFFFSGVLIAEDVDGLGDKGSGNSHDD
jgi:hypothetical protein